VFPTQVYGSNGPAFRPLVQTMRLAFRYALKSGLQVFAFIAIMAHVSSHRNLFYVLTLKVNYNIFWDIMLCSPLKVIQRFGATYNLHLQGRKQLKITA
jgi:hypothetical protein